MKKYTPLIILLLAVFTVSAAAQSGPEFRRSAVHNGNLVRSVFGNWGVIGQPATGGPRGAWLHPNNGYIGDVSPMIGAEIVLIDTVNNDTTVFHSVEISPVSRPTTRREESPAGIPWGFEPVKGYFNENQQSIALSTNMNSWPPFWPDKLFDPEDSGWPGKWNGYFGKDVFNADQESYFVMDDNGDEEFNVPQYNEWNVTFKPDKNDPTRNGLGLEIKVRGLQWSQFLAQDVIFWLYEITNKSTTNYHKVVFGMLVGTYVGVTGSDDGPQEYDDDYSFFDVERDITYTGDYTGNNNRNPNWVGPVGMVGYAFLESPGNPFDGIDNDGDADVNPMFPSVAPLFTLEDFEPRLINAGDRVVLIDENYERTVVTVPDTTITYMTLGTRVTIEPGVTELVEGEVQTFQGRTFINENAFDGSDNDLDGLVDENFYLHYRQIRLDQRGNILIDKLAPVRYKDYITGMGVNDLMIDELRNDGIDNDGDWNPDFDDVGADGKANTGDFGEGDLRPTPGEPNIDGTDVDESDQIGLTSFEYFTPAREISMGDDEELWQRLRPGFFEVPNSIINNRPQNGEDGDFIYGSGYFPLLAGQTERFSLALVYGEGGGRQVVLDDLLKNRETVQQIYNSDYRFPQAPEKPTLTTVPGDGKVTLYWDRIAEESIDPVLKTKDFEGYKIYKATDPDFNDARTVTNADGIIEGYVSIAQFDKKDGITGYFEPGSDLFQNSRGFTYNLGNDTGLRHSFIDTDVENGRRYYYALVAYDTGDAAKDIFPSENTKFISILPTGEVVTDINTSVAIPNAEVAGFVAPEGSQQIDGETFGTGAVYFNVADKVAVRDHNYVVEFMDTSNDGIDNNGNWDVTLHDIGADGDASVIDADGTQNNGLPDVGEPMIDAKDDEEYLVPITTSYSIRDETGSSSVFIAKDTLSVNLNAEHLLEGTVTVKTLSGQEVSPDLYEVDYINGRIKGKTEGGLGLGTYVAEYKYYPVWRSKNILNSPFADETLDSEFFDGIEMIFDNNWNIDIIDEETGWNTEWGYSFSMAPLFTQIGDDIISGFERPCDYEIQFFDDIVDTTSAIFGSLAIPVNFKIFNVTDDKYIDFLMVEIDRNNKLSTKDEIIFLEENAAGEKVFTYDVYFFATNDTTVDFGAGDALYISIAKPFRHEDSFEFTPPIAEVSESAAKTGLDSVRVVPNPYVVATTHEPPLPPGITSGRGERKIDFIHVPVDSKIHIFTSRGEHVITLHHSGSIFDGTVSWNLKTKENLDIAYGVYFYVLQSPVGKKSGKIAIIK